MRLDIDYIFDNQSFVSISILFMKRVFIILVSIFVAAGCAKNDRNNGLKTDDGHVALNAEPSNVSNLRDIKTYTQRDDTDPLKTKFSDKDKIGVFVMTKASATGTPGSGDLFQENLAFQYDNANTKWMQLFDKDHSTLLDFATQGGVAAESRFMAYYPHSSEAGSPFDESSSFVGFPTVTYDIAADQSASNAFFLNDALAATTDVAPTADGTVAVLNMTMQHLNSFIQLRVAKSDEWGSDDKLELKSAAICGVYVKGEYNMTSPTAADIRDNVAVRTGADTTRVFRNYETPVVLQPKTTDYTGENVDMLVVPAKLTAEKQPKVEVLVTHTASDGTVETKRYSCDLPIYDDEKKNTLKANVKYVYNVSVMRGSIEVMLEGPDDWGEGPTATGEVIKVSPDEPTVTVEFPQEIIDNDGMLPYSTMGNRNLEFSIKSTLYSLEDFSIEVLPMGHYHDITDIATVQEGGKSVQTGKFMLEHLPDNVSSDPDVPINDYRTVTVNILHNMTSAGGDTQKEIIKKIQIRQEPIMVLESISPEGNLPAKDPGNVVIRLKVGKGEEGASSFDITPIEGLSVSKTVNGNIVEFTISGFTDNVGTNNTTRIYPVRVGIAGLSGTEYFRNIVQLAAKK